MKAGRSRERTERVENVLTPDADAKEDLLRTSCPPALP